MTHPSRVSLVAAFAAVYVIWGSTYLAIRWGVAEIPPFLMAAGRFLGAGAVFVALAAHRGTARPTARDWLTTGLIGLLMAAGGNGLVSWALQRVPSGIGAAGLDGAVLGGARRLGTAARRPPARDT